MSLNERPNLSSASSDLRQRLITAAIGIPPVLLIAWVGGLPFALLIAVIGLLAWAEVLYIVRSRLEAVALGIFYITLPLMLTIALRLREDGLFWTAAVIILTWFADAFAYVGGKRFGRTPLHSRISPHKTLEGAITGWAVSAMLMGGLLAAVGRLDGVSIWLALGGPVVSIAGDMFESTLKRRYGAKDSHLPHLNLLPGHGGILDRIDSLLFVCTFCIIYIILMGW
jgi:phosphatidate cytidylyltransferase